MKGLLFARMTIRNWPLCCSAGVVALCWARVASAYRPFDGTDANVAEPREVELEIGPAGYRQEGPSRFLVAPALVANYGFARRFEAVLEARQDFQLNASERAGQVQDVAFSIKSLLRRGSLQGAAGLSVALEVGVLLPGFESRLGVQVGSIFSLRLPAITLHLNLLNHILDSLRYESGTSLIVEGPENWPLRPVAELLGEREFGHGNLNDGVTESALVGGIVRWTNAASFDVAARYGHAAGQREEELRVGFTWAFEAW